jgi:hypothetical protein
LARTPRSGSAAGRTFVFWVACLEVVRVADAPRARARDVDLVLVAMQQT